MEIIGRIIAVLPERSGVSARSGSEWRLGSYVLETVGERYPRKMNFEVFGADKNKIAEAGILLLFTHLLHQLIHQHLLLILQPLQLILLLHLPTHLPLLPTHLLLLPIHLPLQLILLPLQLIHPLHLLIHQHHLLMMVVV